VNSRLQFKSGQVEWQADWIMWVHKFIDSSK